jgi:hypothetical protein
MNLLLAVEPWFVSPPSLLGGRYRRRSEAEEGAEVCQSPRPGGGKVPLAEGEG